MKIAVCIKRVPDTEMRFAIAANRTSIDPAGLKFDLSAVSYTHLTLPTN